MQSTCSLCLVLTRREIAATSLLRFSQPEGDANSHLEVMFATDHDTEAHGTNLSYRSSYIVHIHVHLATPLRTLTPVAPQRSSRRAFYSSTPVKPLQPYRLLHACAYRNTQSCILYVSLMPTKVTAEASSDGQRVPNTLCHMHQLCRGAPHKVVRGNYGHQQANAEAAGLLARSFAISRPALATSNRRRTSGTINTTTKTCPDD